jgi:hypothetical protein
MTARTAAELPPEAVVSKLPAGRDARHLGVFGDNRRRPIHRWYPFIEGYSDELVGESLAGLPQRAEVALLDPFGGSGTTSLAASLRGFDSMFCEVNPYLAWIAHVKVNLARQAAADGNPQSLLALAEVLIHRGGSPGSWRHPLVSADRRRVFFPSGVSRLVVGLLEKIDAELAGPVRELARLGVTTSLIPISNMVRRTDLRRRTAGDPPPASFAESVARQFRIIYDDVVTAGLALRGTAVQVGCDARALTSTPVPVTLIVTSPPYLNGTNYCRNTKLELLALGFIDEEPELAPLRAASVTAGINNVSRRRTAPDLHPSVEEVASKLDVLAYDQRIPKLVRLYFSDMKHVLGSLRAVAADHARLLLDIGDSRFAGVHVPTPRLLVDVAAEEGWCLESSRVIRSRRSYDGTALEQVLLTFDAVPKR